MPPREIIVSLRGVQKDYHGLRPLRIQQLELRQGTSMAILGIDDVGAEVLTSLITAAAIPDEGEVDIFGTSTRAITDADHWLRELDRFGVLSERVVLLDQFSVEQNLALPLSLELDALPSAVQSRVAEIAVEVGLTPADLSQPVARLSPAARLRLRLGKALALNPRVLIAEHPNAALSPGEQPVFAADFSRIVSRHNLTSLVLTADRKFAAAVAEEVVALQPATGQLTPYGGWRRWFFGALGILERSRPGR